MDRKTVFFNRIDMDMDGYDFDCDIKWELMLMLSHIAQTDT